MLKDGSSVNVRSDMINESTKRTTVEIKVFRRWKEGLRKLEGALCGNRTLSNERDLIRQVDRIKVSVGSSESERFRLIPGELGVFETIVVFRSFATLGDHLKSADGQTETIHGLSDDPSDFFEFLKRIDARHLQDVWFYQEGLPNFVLIEGLGDCVVVNGTPSFLEEVGLGSYEVAQFMFESLILNSDDQERMLVFWQTLLPYM